MRMACLIGVTLNLLDCNIFQQSNEESLENDKLKDQTEHQEACFQLQLSYFRKSYDRDLDLPT